MKRNGAKMQKIFIDHSSAFQFYQNARANMQLDLLGKDPSKNIKQLATSTAQPSKTAKYTVSSADYYNIPYCGDYPLHIAIANSHNMFSGKKLKTHYLKNGFINNSFVKYSNDIFIASPELVFCQMSKELSIEQLMLLGLEYCGSYALSQSAAEGFICNIQPLSTASKMQKFSKALKDHNNNFPGIKNALTVSKILIDNCASPMEAELYLKLSAPRHLGGYAVKNLIANTRINLSKKASDILGFHYLRADLCIKKSKIAIEYDSNTFHDNTGQNEKDKLRADALQHDG